MLAAAAARLMRPALAAAVARWRGEWHAEEKLRLLRDHDELSHARSELDRTRRASLEELGAQAEAAALELAQHRDLVRDSLLAAERDALIGVRTRAYEPSSADRCGGGCLPCWS